MKINKHTGYPVAQRLTIGSAFVVVLALGICGASAAIEKDSEDFNLKLEMEEVPTPTGGLKNGWTSDGQVLAVNNFQNGGDGYFGFTGQLVGSVGYTMEVRFQISEVNRPGTNNPSSGRRYTAQVQGVDAGGTAALNVIMIGMPTVNAELGVYSQFGNLGVSIAAGEWHTLRIAEEPDSNALLIWLDGMDVSSFDWQSGSHSVINRAWMGDLGGTVVDGIYKVDYLRVDNTGPYEPTNAMPLALPGLVQSPRAETNTVGASITLKGRFSGLVTNLQWFKGDVELPAATTGTYVIGSATVDDSGSYVLRAANAAGFTDTAPAYVQVLDVDPTLPAVQRVQALATLQHVRVTYTKPLLAESATNSENYAVQGGPNVTGAVLVDQYTVDLVTSEQTAGAAYTLWITNVLDLLSNAIAPNTSVSFNAPTVAHSVLYDAGTTASAPAGPPDPTLPEGGNWIATSNPNSGMSAGPVIDDLSTGLNAWQISDQNVATASGFLDYYKVLDPPIISMARANGWRLLANARMVDNFGSLAATPLMIYSDPGSSRRFGVKFNLDAIGNLTAELLHGGTYVVADSSTATQFHTHTLVFDPGTSTASYYFDNQLIAGGYSGQGNITYDGLYNGVVFGCGSPAGRGMMNYNRVQFDVLAGAVAQPEVQIVRTGDNIEVHYTDILEVAPQVSGVYSAIATNTPGASEVYLIPLASQVSQQFFRSRRSE